MANKRASKVEIQQAVVWKNQTWTVSQGQLRALNPGHPGTPSLFKIVAEKIPFEAIDDVKAYLDDTKKYKRPNGIYVAHDSMGCPRYIGRGNIFSRLRSRKKRNKLELTYFSFYVIEKKKHEREVETLLIRAASHLLHFNSRKKRLDTRAGNISDYEAGVFFFRRSYKKGKKSLLKAAAAGNL
jgi:hypothetical protein